MQAFRVLKKSKHSAARCGVITTAHGRVPTPHFMPIATRGVVKTLTSEQVESLKPAMILSNTYHLWLRPGVDLLKRTKGLHNFMRWRGPILTDSGGYQVFSLAKHRQFDVDGVTFRHPESGQKYRLTPELAIKIQKAINSDIMMVLDVCPPSTAAEAEITTAVDLTTAWAKRCLRQHRRRKSNQLLFAIIQGGLDRSQREHSASALTAMDFDGFAIGGLAVGESEAEMYKVLDYLPDKLPSLKPRYLMGVGLPHQIVQAVRCGVDLFDCVIPTREARHGKLYVWTKHTKNQPLLTKPSFYRTITITNAKYRNDHTPIDLLSSVDSSRKYTKAYLHHLFKIKDSTAQTIATMNNVGLYMKLMNCLRGQIKNGTF